jgi:hypothetical protein
LNLRKTNKYLKKIKTDKFSRKEAKSFFKTYFTFDFLVKFWYRKDAAKAINSDNIASTLGNGKTFDGIGYWCPVLVSLYGREKAILLFQEGIDKSSANDKNKRIRQFEKFAARIENRPFFGKMALSLAAI